MSNMQKAHLNSPAQTAARAGKPEHKQKISLKPEQLLDAPETLRHEDVMAAQQQLGNQVVQRVLDKTPRQRDRVSPVPARVMNTDEQGNLNPKIAETIQQMRGSGSPLPDALQKEAGAKFGRGFQNVRIHVDDKADKLSRSINARAFTIGSDIFFKNGVFSPGSSAGRETLIHELTHVVQQSGSRVASGALKLGAPGTAMEKEADQMGKKHSQDRQKPAAATSAAVQMQGEEEELQMQGEEEELQMQAEEEELQMQGEEDELQMQPDAVGTVQREGEDDKIPKAPRMTPKMQLESLNGAVRRLHPGPQKKASFGEKIKGAYSGAKRSILTAAKGVDPESFHGKIQDKSESLRSGKGIQALEETRAKKFKEFHSYSEEPGKDGKLQHVASPGEKKGASRQKLMDTIKNSDSKPEDIKSAQEKLDMLHKRSKTDVFKSFFKKGGSTDSYSKQALALRKKNLKTAAQGGDEDAFNKYKGEKAEHKKEKAEKAKTGTGAKIKGVLGGLVGKVGGFLGSKLGGAVKTQVGNIKTHFSGKSTESEPEADKSDASGQKDSGSSTNTGIGAMMEKYGELVRENQDLKQKLAKLEPKV